MFPAHVCIFTFDFFFLSHMFSLRLVTDVNSMLLNPEALSSQWGKTRSLFMISRCTAAHSLINIVWFMHPSSVSPGPSSLVGETVYLQTTDDQFNENTRCSVQPPSKPAAGFYDNIYQWCKSFPQTNRHAIGTKNCALI